MALLVVPLAPEDTGLLTLDEWDRLSACDRVLFERGDHPLLEKLSAAGVDASIFDDEPEAAWAGRAFVAEPSSPRVLDLARAGADVTAGPALAPDAVSAAVAAPAVRSAGRELTTAVVVMARLRSPDGCPWDQEQDHESLKVHLVEEAYEVLDAIDNGAAGPQLEEELGDVLLQVLFHARMAEQAGTFDTAGVAHALTTKLVRRHPHVFGDVEVDGAGQVLANWEAIKVTEKQREDPFEGIPAALPALLAAHKTQKRATGLGFSGDERLAQSRLRAALEAENDPTWLGEALFWLVAIARAKGLDPEDALRKATARFRSSL